MGENVDSRLSGSPEPANILVVGGKRSLALDVLRALAIFLVLMNHTIGPPEYLPDLLRRGIGVMRGGGWVGVDLFFVLSGFLVSGLLFQELRKYGSLDIKNFLIRRALKIYPALYFLVLVTISVNLAIGQEFTLRQVLGELLFLQNYIGALWGHTWSLAVEEHFYLLLPICLLYLIIQPKGNVALKALPKVFLFFATIELGLRVMTNLSMDYSHGTHMFPSHLRFDSLFFGVLLSYFFHYHTEQFVNFINKWSTHILIVLLPVILIVLVIPKSHFVTSSIGLTFIYLFSGVLLSRLVVGNVSESLLTNLIGYIGMHSYSIYLWHYAVKRWYMEPLYESGVSWILCTISYFVLSVVIGIVMAKLVEMPMLHLRDKIFPRVKSRSAMLTVNKTTHSVDPAVE